ncbi:MAG: PEP-CTERM sorting domain-containing protein [Planctomycetota bacterium]
MKTQMTLILTAGLVAGLANAQSLPTVDGGMKHVLVDFDGTNLGLELDDSLTSDVPPLPMRDFGGSYDGAASVLDGKYYSSQYGFLPDAIITLPFGGAVYVELLSATPGLEIYEGGMRPMRANHTYDPIFGTDGSDAVWLWNGAMHHPWFAAENLGTYEADFRVFIGDAVTAEPLSGFGAADITLSWTAVPAPGTAALLGVGGLVAARRRR